MLAWAITGGSAPEREVPFLRSELRVGSWALASDACSFDGGGIAATMTPGLTARSASTAGPCLYVPEGPHSDEPSFHYTVGLTARQQPEVIVYSLPYESGHGMLNAIAEQVLAGDSLREGEVVSGLPLEAPEIRTFAVTRRRDPLGLATSRYGDAVAVRQVVFPDKDGRWPWQERADRPWLTPLLFDPPSGSAG